MRMSVDAHKCFNCGSMEPHFAIGANLFPRGPFASRAHSEIEQLLRDTLCTALVDLTSLLLRSGADDVSHGLFVDPSVPPRNALNVRYPNIITISAYEPGCCARKECASDCLHFCCCSMPGCILHRKECASQASSP